MSNDIKIFQNTEFSKATIIEIDGEPWFVGYEVAKILGYKKISKMYERLYDDEKSYKTLKFGKSYQRAVIISESGFYSAIFGSRKPEAIKFQDWVIEEVLPAIRKHGFYATPPTIEEILNNPDKLIEIIEQLEQDEAKKTKQSKNKNGIIEITLK